MERYYWLNKDSREFLSRGYLNEGVTPEQRIREIAETAERILGIQGYADKFKNYMSRGWISLSTPVWSNFGLRALPISCYTSYAEDTMEGILYANAEVGMMSKQGGGTAMYLGDIRPRGSKISTGGTADGPVHFAKLTDTIVDIAKQADTRRGSCAVYLPIEHPDIEEFLQIKHEGNPIQNLQYGVTVSDVFMQEMVEGDKEKRKIWAKVIASRSDIGFPYIFFTDNANNAAPEEYKQHNKKIYSSNLCVSGDTQILTDVGYQPIVELQDEQVNIWNGEEWSKVTVRKTGENQKLVRVTTDSGYTLDCTPYHKFYIKNSYWGDYIEKRANELVPGDKLIKFDLPIIQGEKELKYAYQNGFYSGDGCLTVQGQRIYLYGEKKALAGQFSDCVNNWTVQDKQDRMYGHTNLLKDKFFVPDSSYTIESRINWLSGLLDADGCVTNNNGSQSLQITSIEKEFLNEIQLMLQTLGVDSKIIKQSDGGPRLMPKNDGTGELAEYNCKESNRILINGNSLFKLSQLGLSCKRLTWDIKLPNRECSRFIKIKSVEEIDGLHDTFCFTEPKRHMGMFNGILTGQCSEIMLSINKDESFVCCLSSVNLYHFDEWKETDLVETMIYFLDAVMTEFIQKARSIPFMNRAVKFAEEQRALGLGVLGWHSYLQKNMIPIESMEAKFMNTFIFKTMRQKADKASEELARLFGVPMLLQGSNRRNVTTLAIAPTKSSSFILGQVSMGIEPIKSNYFIKDLAKSKTVYKNPELVKLLESKNKNTKEVWDSILSKDGSVQHLDFLNDTEKGVFKTFVEISQLELVQQNAVRQKYIDQGISFNLSIHPSTPAKDINKLYIEAWKLGLKSLYYQFSENSAQAFARNINDCVSCEA
jgi:ribonucleoside-diphosphate reductase alpha chain